MHGATQLSIPNRKGRKRKSGRRTASGAVVRAPIDYRAMAALQPHRIRLPEALRGDEKAESVLGCLNLIYRISKRTAGNRPGITDAQYEAGRRYSVLVGAYLAMAGAPRSTAGSGYGGHTCLTGACDKCRATTDQYMRAHEAIGRDCMGVPRIARQTHAAVNWVVIDDHLCNAEQFDWLKRGLSALADHFGLTNHRKQAHARNTN
jgi:hypothetical protein